MKRLLSLFIVLTAIILLSACKKDDPKTTNTNDSTTTTVASTVGFQYDFSQTQHKKVTLTVWLDDSDGTWGDQIKPAFEAENPDIILNIHNMSTVDAETQLMMVGQAGDGADVFQFPHDHLASALQNDLLAALPQAYVDDLNDRENPTALSIGTACYNDETQSLECTSSSTSELFGAPLSLESVALYYNIDILTDMVNHPDDYDFSAFNLDGAPTSYQDIIPQTFQQLISLSDQYTDNNPGQYGFLTNYNDSYFMNFALTAFGYQPFGPDQNDADNPGINSQATIDGLTWMKDNLMPMYPAGSTNDGLQSQTNGFDNGDLPFIITGPWSNATYDGDGINYGVTSIPTIDVDGIQTHPLTFTGAQMLGLYKYSSHPDAAIKFLQFMTSTEGLQIMYDVQGKLPALNEDELSNIDGLDADQHLQGMAEQLQYSMPMPTIPEIQAYWEPVRQMFQDVWNANMDPAQAAQKAENAYNQTK